MNDVGGQGSRAPDFRLPVLGGGFRGLSDVVAPRGGVLVFFKDGCPASDIVVPRLASLAAALRAEGRLLLAVAQEDEAGTRAFRDRHGIAEDLAWDAPPHPASRAYVVSVVPTLFVVDGSGLIAARMEGFVKSEYLTLGATLHRALALGHAPPALDRPEELPEIKPG